MAAPLFGVIIMALGLVQSCTVLLALLVATGFLQVVHTATTNTMLQAMAPDDLRGRVMSVYVLAFLGLMPFGSLAAGAVAERLSPAAWFVGSGVLCTVLMVGALRVTPEVRSVA